MTSKTDVFVDSVFEILRGAVNPEDFQLLLFLISIKKDGYELELHDCDNAQMLGIEFEFWCRENRHVEYLLIFDILKVKLNRIPEKLLKHLIIEINDFDSNFLESNFLEIFEALLKSIFDYQGKRSSDSIQPQEISQLIMNFADLQDEAKIYNPFAGLASFGTNLCKNQEYYAQEINESTWAIGQLRLKAHNGNFAPWYYLQNSIENWFEHKNFDLIVATPPFGFRIRKNYRSHLTGEDYKNVETFLIDRGIHSLKNNGKLIVVLPLSFLFNGGRVAKFKKGLIENDLIDSVITLPSGLFSNTSIPVCIVVLKKIATRPGYVKFVDASSFYNKDGIRSRTLKYIELLELLKDDSENQFIRYIDTKTIRENDFDLSVGRYFLQKIIGVELLSFSSIIKGPKAPGHKSMKQVQIRDLKDDVFDSTLTSDELESKVIKRGTFRIIEESCLLIATRWNTLKPTFFKYTGEPIVISLAVVALKFNEDIVDPTFLINEFSADYVQEQVLSYRVGSVQPMLRKKDLEKIIFKLPSMQEQRAKVSGIIELSTKLRKLKIDKEDLLSGYKKEETESSTSLSHILGKPLLSIGSSLEIIQNALYKLDPNWKNHLISYSKQFTLSDAFDSISKNVKYIQELADENTSLVSVSNFELTELHFLKFLSEFIKNEKKSLNNKISLHLDIHHDIKEQMNNQVLVKGNPQKLRIVLINLIDNAKTHAFVNNDEVNKINIEILPFSSNEKEASFLNYNIDGKRSYIEVKVSNTGSSFPKDFTLKDYVRKNFAAGKKRNRGLGGYEVNEILKTHNEGKNALNINSNKIDSEYTTTISFVIPLL